MRNSPSVSIAVLVSASRHPVSSLPRACRGDAVAMALGRTFAGDALRVIHAGDPTDEALQDYLALGADRIEVLSIAAGHDPLAALTDYAGHADIIVTGLRSEQGAGSGLLPYTLAHALRRPIVANVLDARIDGGELNILQFLPKGQRRTIAAPMPIVLAVHPLAPATLTYAYAKRVSGRIDVVASTAPAARPSSTPWAVEPTPRRAVPLKADDHKDGYDRMLALIQSPSRGGVVAFEGSSVDKAQILLTYLRDHRLVDF